MKQRSRRSFLGLVGVAGAAGCLGDRAGVRVLSAGSLARTFEHHVGPAFETETGVSLDGEYYGTNAALRLVADRTKRPDVVVSADATLLRDRLYGEFADWDVEFAANSLGVGYSTGSAFGRRLKAGEPWYDLFRDAEAGDVAIGDPDLDPLGYRAVQALELAQRYHDLPGLREDVLAVAVREPEEAHLMTSVETGSREAAIVYRNMAVDHGMGFLAFPDAYSFADPERDDHYATVEYTTADGYVADGRPVVYNATVSTEANKPALGRRLVRFLLDEPGLLEDAGLTVPSTLPRTHGSVPAGVVA